MVIRLAREGYCIRLVRGSTLVPLVTDGAAHLHREHTRLPLHDGISRSKVGGYFRRRQHRHRSGGGGIGFTVHGGDHGVGAALGNLYRRVARQRS